MCCVVLCVGCKICHRLFVTDYNENSEVWEILLKRCEFKAVPIRLSSHLLVLKCAFMSKKLQRWIDFTGLL